MMSHYLYPGKLFATSEPTEITTILGSCVAVALFDPVTKSGGLNHFLLPSVAGENCDNPRYGRFAIPELVRQMEALGVPRRRLEAKIYGGGSVLAETTIEIGKNNIETAIEILGQLGIPVVEKNVGGNRGRRIAFQSNTFEIKHQLMGESGSDDVDVSGYARVKMVKECKVLIVDDSATVRNLFQKIFTQNGLTVVGTAANAFEARNLLVQMKPDVMTLDIEMPVMTGVAFLEKIMQHMPTPTVMVSSLGSQGEAALKSLELGAIEFVQKPSQYDVGELRTLGQLLVDKVRAAASTNVLRHRPRTQVPIAGANKNSQHVVKASGFNQIHVIGVCGNAGSQKSLETFLKTLAADTPAVVVANATVSSFLSAYIEKIKNVLPGLTLKIAEAGLALRMGTVYFAPAGRHLKVKKAGDELVLDFQSGLPVYSQIPSGSILFESIAAAAPGQAMGVLLGGFGVDGVAGLTALQEKKCITFAEDPSAAMFPYGPQEAINNGVADHICLAGDMNKLIMDYRNKRAA